MNTFMNRSMYVNDSGAEKEEPGANDPLFMRATARTMQVLSAFHETERPLSLSEIARITGLDRSATQRIVHTLRQLGYIQRDPYDRGYVPGIRVYDHTFDAMRLNRLMQPAAPLLQDLRRAVKERVNLALVDDLRLVYSMRLPPLNREVLHGMLLGVSVPIYCTSGGWAVLAQLEEDEARDIIRRSQMRRYTARTLMDEEEIMEKVAEAAQQGYVLAEEQLLPGEIAIGAAITGADGRPAGAVNVTALLSDWTPEDFTRAVVPSLFQTVSALSRN